MKRLNLLTLLLAMIMASCGDDSQFRIAGTIEGLGTQNIRLIYYSDGAVRAQTTTVIDGKFSTIGYAPKPTILEIYSSDKALLGRLMVKNGETIECSIDRGNRYKASFEGNSVSSQWGKFLSDNAETLSTGDYTANNELIAKYITANSNNTLSTVLLLTEFYTPENELLADSLLSSIALEARPRDLVDSYASMLAHLNSETARGNVRPMNLYSKGDSLYSYNPSASSFSLLCFSMPDRECRDSIVPQLSALSKKQKTETLKIIDISFAEDTTQWKRSIKKDDATWNQCWALGSVQAKGIDRLAIPRTPYFIVADSAGRQLYRGSSISNASEVLNNNFKK